MTSRLLTNNLKRFITIFLAVLLAYIWILPDTYKAITAYADTTYSVTLNMVNGLTNEVTTYTGSLIYTGSSSTSENLSNVASGGYGSAGVTYEVTVSGDFEAIVYLLNKLDAFDDAITETEQEYSGNTYNLTVNTYASTNTSIYNEYDDCAITNTGSTAAYVSRVSVGSIMVGQVGTATVNFAVIPTGVWEVEYTPSYTITTSVTNGTISATGTVEGGTSKTITYSPDTGYALKSVTVDGQSVSTTTYASSYTFSDITEDHTISVVYETASYTISTSVTGGTITSSQTVDYGGSTTISYAPKTGYTLKSVTVDGVSKSTSTFASSYTFSDVTANHTIAVVYEKQTYTITTSATGGTITSTSTVAYGDSKTISYAANTGYTLKSVTVDGSAVNISTYPTAYTFSNVTASHTISVVYEKSQYTVTTSVTNGIISDNSTVYYGDSVTVTYRGISGYELSSLTIDGVAVSVTDYPVSYTFSNISSNHTINAVYTERDCVITTSVTNGTITDTTTVSYGGSATISYTPSTGFSLESVIVDGISVDITAYPSSYTFSDISSDHTISVTYSTTELNISTSAVNGTITAGQIANYGDTVTISYAPNEGYELSSVTVDNATVDITLYPNSYTFSDITANHAISVVYTRKSYTITTSADANGTITASSTVLHGNNKTVAYEATADGYVLESVIVDGTPIDITEYPYFYTFEDVSSDHTIEVTFTIDTNIAIVTSVTNGTITPTKTYSATYGESVTIYYEPDYGYTLISVIVDGESIDVTAYPTSYTFDSVATTHYIDVVYGDDDFTITTAVTNGTITNSVDVVCGETTTIAYTPNEGYYISSIIIDGETLTDITGYETYYTFTNVTTDHTIHVIYEIYKYTVTTNVTDGSISATATKDYGTDYTVEYIPDNGYELYSVTVDGTPVDITLYPTSYTFSYLTEDHNIDVVFVRTYYSVPTISAENTSVTLQITQPYNNTITVFDADVTDTLTVTRTINDGTPETIITLISDGEEMIFTDTYGSFSKGTYTIVYTVIDNAGNTASTTVNVVSKGYSSNGGSGGSNNTSSDNDDNNNTITITPNPVSLNVGDTQTLTADDSDITWSSSDDSVATVDQNGVVTGVSEGTAIITATNDNGSGTVTVIVTDDTIYPTSIIVTPHTSTGNTGDTVSLTAVVTPSDADTTVTWTTSDSTIATVDQNGNVTLISGGTATITATTSNGLSDSATITITDSNDNANSNDDDNNSDNSDNNDNDNDDDSNNNSTDSVTSVTPSASVIYVGSSVALTANADVTWSSSDPTIAYVDQNGNVIGLSVGTVIITATADDGSTATATITVIDGNLNNTNAANYYPYYYYGSLITDDTDDDNSNNTISDIDLDNNAIIEHVDVGAGIESDDDIINDDVIGNDDTDAVPDEIVTDSNEPVTEPAATPIINQSPATGDSSSTAIAIVSIIALTSAIIILNRKH